MDILGKHVDLSIDQPDKLYRFVHALDSPVRIRIMQALGKRSMNVGELAQALDIPMSTTALAVRTLEEAGIIRTQTQPGARGSVKLCSRKLDTMMMHLAPADGAQSSALVMRMPIGGYSTAEGITPTCGIAGDKSYIGDMDNPLCFYVTERFDAQLIWFQKGMLEYRFSFPHTGDMLYDWLEVSFEACSEAPMYRDPWKSDISVYVNDKRLGIWTCPCDCGGRHGKLTPGWWPDLSTQFGFLKTWRVDDKGSYLENVPVSNVRVSDLKLEAQTCISVRIGVEEDAENAGGINLFGERFGDYDQPLILRIGYHMRADNGTKKLE